MPFVSHHKTTSDADLLCAYAEQHDDLLKQVDGAKQLLAAQHSRNLLLRYYRRNLYLLTPGGIDEPARCGRSGPLG